MASESSEREKVYELFERAVKDYICKLLRCYQMYCVAFRLELSFPRKAFSLCYNAETGSKTA